MASYVLVMGNKNYSSWSIRPWMAMKVAGIDFDEIIVPLDQKDTRERILKHAPAGKVPVLKHGDLTVWDSLAILAYLCELHPDAKLLPAERAARAWCRSVSAEMHAGFQALRKEAPMNIRRAPAAVRLSDAARNDVRRIEELWVDCRARFGAGGPFLFGGFSVADAMYAPVVNRLHAYEVKISPASRAYMEAVMALPAWKELEADARAEPWTVPSDEVK